MANARRTRFRDCFRRPRSTNGIAGTSGIVEADEVYLGKTKGHGHGAHITRKQQVVALVERKGRVRAFHVAHITANTLKPKMRCCVLRH